MLTIRFDNLDQVRKAFSPSIVEQATKSAIRKLTRKVSTAVSREVRQTYNVRAGDINRISKVKMINQGGLPAGMVIYTSKRLDLRYFSTASKGAPSKNARPRVKSSAGTRYGARVKIRKTSPAKIIKGGFWAAAGGAWQIYKRKGSSRLPLRKLTGPSISQMVRGKGNLQVINRLMSLEADRILSSEMDFYLKRQAGIK